jgi:tetratricopeptide (TPR) repeat protein
MPLSSRAVIVKTKLGAPSTAFALNHPRHFSLVIVLTASKMPLDKVKTLRAAEKYLELGKIPAAIKEYSQIIQIEPDDFATLNTLGDLYVRVGNPPAASSCFHRIAQHYREQGFGLKAIAMYKKIDRLQPNNIDVTTILADLYAQQGLVVEARSHYLVIADSHSRSGATHDALAILHKIADLDPQNTEIRTRLAQGYLKQNMPAEAAACFTEAGQRLLERGAFDNSLEAFGKALEIRPADYASLAGLLSAHAARGTADEAAESIEAAAADHPDDSELLSMLAKAYVEADDPVQAERVTGLLYAKDSSQHLRFVDVARLFLKDGKISDAVRIVGEIAEQMLAAREESYLLDLVHELLTCDADNVQALRLLVRAHWWQRDMEELRAALERLAEAAQAAGLNSDERYALTQLRRIAPERTDFLYRLNELGGPEDAAASEPLPEIEPPAESVSPEPPTYAQFEIESHSLSDSDEATGFQLNQFAEPSDHEAVEAVSEPEFESGFTFEAVVAEELPTTGKQTESDESTNDEARKAAVRAQELESVDFYIAQGYKDIALDTLSLLEQQFGSHPDIDARRHQLEQIAEAGTVNVAEATVTFEAEAVVGALPEPVTEPAPIIKARAEPKKKKKPEPPPPAIDPGLAEIFEEYRASAEDGAESAANGDYETHYNLGLAYKEMDLFEDALEEFQMAVKLVSPGDGTPRYLHCCNLLGHCFMRKDVPQLAVKWFQQGLNAPDASEDERQALRFELAAAYEEAGDLDRAKDLFTEVYGNNVSYRGVSERLRTVKARLSGANGKNSFDYARDINKEQRVS